ncbi:hypothetical protein M011DRAFT_471308 [Sporormia fimetaria CBS 119925]|uniref:EamA domain-containing protein n=1 Tax=Sporormia fimetaria CBS 119925 TaxID=1340428 RepID=A0A6A6V1R5_9PLEO|nr:hypothetical protein M011DRAFT_471308 [Sporormia fimetaria CBS 119925]
MAPHSPLSVNSFRASEEGTSDIHSHDPFASEPVHSPASIVSAWDEERKPQNRIRHALGICLLMVTVFLWTASNFLASTIFADDSYTKPYLVTYTNTAFFIIPLIPMLLRHAWDTRSTPSRPLIVHIRDLLTRRVGRYKLLQDHESPSLKPHDSSARSLLLSDDPTPSVAAPPNLTLQATIRLSFEFCILWFVANYFASACLGYTTVASATILGSTSSIWTLLFGTLLRVEVFSFRKFIGVLASLCGVALISSIDVSGTTDSNRGSFPHKSPAELLLGDAMAFFSAVLYGIYAVLMKKRIGDERRVNMPLFFGLVGLINLLLLWPGLVVLHFTGTEPFELPPTKRITTIVLVNSASSLVSDYSWAYAMLLTSPLVVSVGLSLTIPLSLVGQMVISGQYASPWYWVGAVIVVGAFVWVNREEGRDGAH